MIGANPTGHIEDLEEINSLRRELTDRAIIITDCLREAGHLLQEMENLINSFIVRLGGQPKW